MDPPHGEFMNGDHLGVHNSGNACSIDDMILSESLNERKTSNAYFETVFTVDHQSFCPLIMDEVRVVGDFRVYHDEGFSQEIHHPTYNINQGVGVQPSHQAFSNDVLYY